VRCPLHVKTSFDAHTIHDDQRDNPGQETQGSKVSTINCDRSFVSDIAIFVLKRDVKLQLTNLCSCSSVPRISFFTQI